jgi:hypothetical protein
VDGTLLRVVGDIGLAAIIVIVIAAVAFHRRVIAYVKREIGIDDLRDEMCSRDLKLQADILRNTILLNIHQTPHKAEVIDADYMAYKALGGNGYLDGVIDEWRKSYRNGLIAKRLGTWDGNERRGKE